MAKCHTTVYKQNTNFHFPLTPGYSRYYFFKHFYKWYLLILLLINTFDLCIRNLFLCPSPTPQWHAFNSMQKKSTRHFDLSLGFLHPLVNFSTRVMCPVNCLFLFLVLTGFFLSPQLSVLFFPNKNIEFYMLSPNFFPYSVRYSLRWNQCISTSLITHQPIRGFREAIQKFTANSECNMRLILYPM